MATRRVQTSGKGARSKTPKGSGFKPPSAQSRTDSGLPDSDEYSSDEWDSNTKKSCRPKRSSKSARHPDGKVKVAIDLTDPNDLLDKMDKLQLTEEETEELLKQAYSINRKLKQQMRDTDEGSTFPASAKSQVLPPIGHGTKHSGTVSAHNRRQHSGSSSGSRISAKRRQRPEWVD